MISSYSEQVDYSVLCHSYDKLLRFWTHRFDFFNIFCYFHENMLDNVFSVLHMVEFIVGDMVCKAPVFLIQLLEFRFVLRCFYYL